MIIMLIASIALAIIGVALMWYSESSSSSFDWLIFLFGIVLIIVGALGLITLVINVYNWKAASVKAELINREYGTQYTQEEVFYASGVINTIRELDRKRIEVNGDLFRDKEQKED